MGAPLNPVPQVLRVFIEGFIDGDDVYKWGNVLHFKYTGGAPTSIDCANLAAQIRNGWADDMAAECPSPTTLRSVTVTDLTSDSAGSGEWLGNVPGTRGDDSIPANAAVLVSYPSGLRYKGGHPRTYLYVGGNADLEGAAHWSTAFTSEVESHWRSFIVDCLSASSGSTNISTMGFVRYRGKYLPNSGAPHYYLDTPLYEAFGTNVAVTAQEMASQRRRIGRRRS